MTLHVIGVSVTCDNVLHKRNQHRLIIIGIKTSSFTPRKATMHHNARFSTSDSCRYDHVKPLLNDLHWLLVPEHITYKLCVLVYNCMSSWHGAAVQDVIQPISEVTSRRRLRSASSSALVVPATRRSSLGDRDFAVAGPRAWNSLSEFVTDCSSPLTFKEYVKTCLFSLSF